MVLGWIQFPPILGIPIWSEKQGAHRKVSTLSALATARLTQHVSLSTDISDGVTSFIPFGSHFRWKFWRDTIAIQYFLGSCIWPPIDSSSSIPKLESTGVSDSSGYRWCSPRCNVSRYPQCCYNPVCRSKKPMGCVWHLYAGANPDMHDDILL